MSLAGVSFSYGANLVLRDVSLEIHRSECLLLVGHNGSSKSTLLRVLAGLARPREGSVSVEATQVAGYTRRRAVSLGVAYLPQTGGYFPGLTVQENFSVAQDAARHLPSEWSLEDVVEERFGSFLSAHREKRASALSGGQRQILRVAMTLMQRPRVAIFDEPSIGLSPQLGSEVFSVFETIGSQRDVTCVIAEQNIPLGLRVADRVAVMRLGELVGIHSSAEFRESGIGLLFPDGHRA
jgi:ABC-type branched-subunit amino acid transport system ATPase component